MAVDLNASPIEQTAQTSGDKGEKKKKKHSKKVFINEKIFGDSKTLAEVNAEEGISHLKIKAQEIGNIPGLIAHWRAEVNKRKKEIRAYKNTSFMQRTASLIKGESVSPSVSGEELSRYHPTKAALEKVKLLKRDPTDMMARLELVSIVAKSGRDLPIEVYRTLLLQATLACCFGEFSNAGLQMVIWTQDIYFSKLFYKCQGEALALSSKIEKEEGKNNAFSRQSQGLKNHIGMVTRNMEIIKSYQKQTEKALKESKAVHNTALHLDEITSFLLEVGGKEQRNRKQDEKCMSIVKRAAELLLLLRVLPLLREETDKLSNHLKKLDENDPVPHFLEAKIQMTDLIFKVGMYKGGERTPEMINKIQESFKKTHNLYGLAVKKVGKLPKTEMECNVLIEYANLMHYFYKISKTILGINLPVEWLGAVFPKAIKLLQLIQEKGKVDGLMRDLHKDMSEAGISGSDSGGGPAMPYQQSA